MKTCWWPLGPQTLTFLSILQSLRAVASPAINVALKASFNSAPYLVELLETAAEENSTAYFPILDRIAEGYFQQSITDHELYTSFLDLLQKDGHITDPETLSAFQFALSVHSAAPRIEAHYQFYNTSVEPSLQTKQGSECEVWVELGGKQYCSPQLDEVHDTVKGSRTTELPFDRVLGNATSYISAIIYADITSPAFAKFHPVVSQTARDGQTSYRVRYKPSLARPKSPLVVSGYGVELALKRTDYIVIDDRPAEQSVAVEKNAQKPLQVELHDEEVADLKPLSASELSTLGVNAASFVLNSDQPLDTLLKLTQDFPKHSSAISTHNASNEFLTEHRANREQQVLMPGSNVIWINGVQVGARDVDAFSLLALLRRERKLINGVRDLGFSGPEAINLLSHSAITESQVEDEPQRYDFRDELEGGHVIMWLNDIAKDKRYEDWPSSLAALLQRTYPGQLPSVRRDIHNAIVATDFSNLKDVTMVVETLQNLVKRKVPIRWGLVPITTTAGSTAQARVVYHFLENYGISAMMTYLQASANHNKLSSPDKATFEATIKHSKLRKDHSALGFDEVLKSEGVVAQLAGAKQYLARLAADGSNPPIFINGVPVTRNDEWLQSLSTRVTIDLRSIQKGVFEDVFNEDAWLPSFFLFQASPKRNPLVVPENEKNVTLLDMAKIHSAHAEALSYLPSIAVRDSTEKESWAHLLIVADFGTMSGSQLLSEVVEFRRAHDNVEIVFIHNPGSTPQASDVAERLFQFSEKSIVLKVDDLYKILSESSSSDTDEKSMTYWSKKQAIVESLGLKPGETGLILSGRLVGPIPEGQPFDKADLESLLAYETKKRIQPATTAIQALELSEKIDSPLSSAKITSLVAISTISDVPEGIFESASTLRSSIFNRWNSSHTAIIKGDIDKAIFQIVAAVDPASEIAQRWVPILNVLSELSGVHLRLFLYPRDRLDELPVKRFYRYILDSKPSFHKDGSVKDLGARFTGIPAEALLTMGMDVPPSWLVAPEDCIHDLDNIKLSSLGDQTDINAIYKLENILIQGHSRDVTNGVPPRGAELVLGTERNPHFADTIIMANLGYFQFKANPGFFKIELKRGKSQEIFKVDSAGTKGYGPQLGDDTTEIALMSFQGTTLFPRLSRKSGMEEADVLATPSTAASDLASKGTELAYQLLSKVGLSGSNTEKWFSQGSKLWSSVLARFGLSTDAKPGVQADINIFSVASGHLYERMLNIMMLSVMKHTKHTVKFWFIEQFLSPSFKSFLPIMAAEFGFDYEMVTYKWPHWLRGQKEKQREIWGYKILFLDVLFPLDLDKVIFVDADQIVRTDMYELVTHDLRGAPYGFTPMCDSRTEMEGFRFWKQGYWKNFLRGLPYHISALYVVDLKRFRQIAAGDRLRQQYQQLSADPASLSNLDQDLPNNMQMQLPIHSLPQEWLWCETWCSDESLKEAKTIDLCNNPLTKEPKLDRARRQVPEWNVYDEEIAALAQRVRGNSEKKTRREESTTWSIKDEL
ncbi:glycosyltransferase family 24 protein [Lepidopterella palustris CBS 459.81]|uniref:Glycosyltransferase family 24 protein n=1 Tax=Lepidopterella palustris CBS 459.81 TaxID=1314670 RepID=A0A8E2JBQ0_9PEZI|nr:glycosyltransferase family 24 protein [Lepidopterella palustris CBS 459.81]